MSKGKRAKKKKGEGVINALLVILLILLLAAGGLFIFIQIKLGEINRVKPSDFVPVGDTSAAIDIEEAQEWSEAGVTTKVEGVVNILLVGQDTRKAGQRERSDTMILLSVNKNSNQLTMISLMRDLYVQIPGYGGRKLNAAYEYGGFDLLDETLSTNLGLTVDYNVEVDFTGFKDIVDTLGGVDITLTEDEAAYLRGEGGNYVNGVVGRYTHGRTYDVQAGLTHMNGTLALDYARARHVGTNADFGRTERQRVLIKTIYNDVKHANWLKLLKVYDSVADNVTTDMTNAQILSIAFSAYSMGKSEINSYRIPANGMYYNANYGRGLDVLVPKDWEVTRQLLNDFLYSDDGGAAAFQNVKDTYGAQEYN